MEGGGPIGFEALEVPDVEAVARGGGELWEDTVGALEGDMVLADIR